MKGATIIGGLLHPTIEMSFSGGPPVTDEDIKTQALQTEGLGLPDISEVKGSGPRLAVVGGGSSIADHVETLKNWDGEIWAINGAWHYLNRRGIKSTFFAIDPHKIVGEWAKGVTGKAVIVTRCHPDVFKVLCEQGVQVVTYNIEDQQVKVGASTSSAAPHLAAIAGHHEVTFFGCESSYEFAGNSHCYMNERLLDEMIVRCGDKEFLTRPDYLIQAMQLGAMLNAFPEYLKEQSGGLLRAMMENDGYYETVWISDSIANGIEPKIERKKPVSDEDRLVTTAEMAAKVAGLDKDKLEEWAKKLNGYAEHMGASQVEIGDGQEAARAS